MKVLVIPEDPTLDAFILQPIVQCIFEDLNKSANVEVLRDPHMRGIDQALSPPTIEKVLEMNPMVDLFCLIVDRDCDRARNSARVRALEERHRGRLVACLAVHEIEVWMLALFDHDVEWGIIRAECDPKERYATPFLQARGWSTEVGRGRKRAMRAISGNWRRLVSRCPEIRALSEVIQQLDL